MAARKEVPSAQITAAAIRPHRHFVVSVSTEVRGTGTRGIPDNAELPSIGVPVFPLSNFRRLFIAV